MTRELVAVYEYGYNGPDLWKNRYEPKEFKMFARSPKHPHDGRPLPPTTVMRMYPDSAPYFHSLLYGLPLVLTDPPRVALAEGEKDADILTAAGVPAVSHWGGALRFTSEQAERFRGYTGKIILACDRDDTAIGYADAVRRYDRLTAVGIATDQLAVALPRFGKDAADALAHYGPDVPWFKAFERISIAQLRQRAARYTPPIGGGDGGGFDYHRDASAELQRLGLHAADAHWDYGTPYATEAEAIEAKLCRQAELALEQERRATAERRLSNAAVTARQQKGGSV